MSISESIPRLIRELDFKVEKEEWLVIKLRDGSTIKFKTVLLKVFETDIKNPMGEPLYSLEGHNVVSVRSPESLRGKPSERLPDPLEALKMPKEEIEIVEIIDPSWNSYVLENGKRIKTKTIITNIYRIKDIFDKYGNPYYVIESQTIASSSPTYMPPQFFDQISEGGKLNYLQSFKFTPSSRLAPEHGYTLFYSLIFLKELKFDLPTTPDWRGEVPSLEVMEKLRKLTQGKLREIKLAEDVLTPLSESLFARKTADGKIEIFEVIE